MAQDETVFENDAWPSAEPRLSVLAPFLRDDPRPLLAALDREAAGLGGAVEIVLLDDGGGDAALTGEVAQAVRTAAMPARLVSLAANAGRAKGRNRMAAHARGRWFLFLDSDMLPDSPRFLRTYLDLIARHGPAVACGGFSLDQTPQRREHALHRRMALASDCTPADVRRLTPEKHVFTSNLLVRRDVFESEAFDEGFAGWGWEDVEWAMRVAQRRAILHIDNTATHLGLDTAAVMAGKYEQSVANFARVVAGHRATVARYPSYRAARWLKRLPGRVLWRAGLKQLALAEPVPLSARAIAMRLYRAALYADVV
jgi:glycosyltransferase involved in cell wall biosynthesis